MDLYHTQNTMAEKCVKCSTHIQQRVSTVAALRVDPAQSLIVVQGDPEADKDRGEDRKQDADIRNCDKNQPQADRMFWKIWN